MQVLAVSFEYAGAWVDVPAIWLLEFLGLCLILVAIPLYFNRSINHDGDYVDEYWGDGSIDDDDWGVALAEARRTTSRRLAELAARSGARVGEHEA